MAQVSDAIKEYLPLPRVLAGLLGMYQDLLGLKFVEVPQAEAAVWHEHVQLFVVNDAATGELVGHFYLDLFPREGDGRVRSWLSRPLALCPPDQPV